MGLEPGTCLRQAIPRLNYGAGGDVRSNFATLSDFSSTFVDANNQLGCLHISIIPQLSYSLHHPKIDPMKSLSRQLSHFQELVIEPNQILHLFFHFIANLSASYALHLSRNKSNLYFYFYSPRCNPTKLHFANRHNILTKTPFPTNIVAQLSKRRTPENFRHSRFHIYENYHRKNIEKLLLAQ